MVIEAALAELQRGSDVVHRRAVIALLMKQTCSSAQYFLARIGGGVASHCGKEYTGRREIAKLDRLVDVADPLPCISHVIAQLRR